MKLYHYSDRTLREVNPKFYGDNDYTPKRHLTKVSYYYTENRPHEYRFNLLKCHIVSLSDSKIYTFKSEDYEKLDICLHIQKIFDSGYNGILYKQGNYNVCIVNKSLKVEGII